MNPPSSASAASTAACGQCGYDVRSLPTFICPECGADLRIVGIKTRGSSNPFVLLAQAISGAWKRMLIWTLGLAACVTLVLLIFVAFIATFQVWPSAQATLEPQSAAYKVLVHASGKPTSVDGWLQTRNFRKVKGQSMSLTLAPQAGVFVHNTTLQIDLTTWSSNLYHWTAGTAPSQKPQNFNRAQLEAFFKAVNIDTTPAPIQAELDSLMSLIDQCRNTPLQTACASAQNFKMPIVSDNTTSNLSPAYSTPLGPPALFAFLSLWFPVMLGVVVRRMYLLRAGAIAIPPSSRPARGADDLPKPAAPRTARTVTVLFSDIKDYTARSTASSRTGAIELVDRHRNLATPAIHQHHGQIVKTIGDAILATFESATDAVLAGLQIQSATATHNQSATPAEQLNLRIAIASGEVIVEAGDLYGQTVNLASRLQSVASPGQVILSAPTQALVNPHEVPTTPAGPFTLAGFAAPVPAFIAKPAHA